MCLTEIALVEVVDSRSDTFFATHMVLSPGVPVVHSRIRVKAKLRTPDVSSGTKPRRSEYAM